MSKLDDLLKRLGPQAADALQKLSEPQRRLLQGIAKGVGAKAEGESSEAASQAIVEQIAQKLGLPDSTLANLAKAGGVAALETFADPLGPIGKVAKGAKILSMAGKGAKVADKAADVAKVATEAEKAQAMANILKRRELRKAAQAPQTVVRPSGAEKKLEALAAAKPATPEQAAQLSQAFGENLKKTVDPGKFTPTLDKRTHGLTSGEEYQRKINAIKDKTEGAPILDYGSPSMKIDKPEGDVQNYRQLLKDMIKKNQGK